MVDGSCGHSLNGVLFSFSEYLYIPPLDAKVIGISKVYSKGLVFFLHQVPTRMSSDGGLKFVSVNLCSCEYCTGIIMGGGLKLTHTKSWGLGNLSLAIMTICNFHGKTSRKNGQKYWF